MTDLHFVDRARAAARHILAETPIGAELERHTYDDGRLLTITADCDDWGRMSSGLKVLFGVLEQLAGQRSTVTIHDVGHRLDEESRRAVVSAYEAFLIGAGA